MPEAREYYTWCPHGTGNPQGCGVCIKHREAFDALEFLRKVRALASLHNPVSSRLYAAANEFNLPDPAENEADPDLFHVNALIEHVRELRDRRRDDAIYCASQAFSEGIKAAVRKKTSFDASGFVDKWLAELDAEREAPPSEVERKTLKKIEATFEFDSGEEKSETPVDISGGDVITDEDVKDEIVSALNQPFVERMERVLQVFVDTVNRQAEQNMLTSGKLEGSHYAAMQNIDRSALVREVLKRDFSGDKI